MNVQVLLNLPRSWVITRLDLGSGVEPLKILDEVATIIAKVSEENNFATAPKQKQGVKRIEDCDRGLMNSGADGTAGQRDSFQSTHYNSGSSSVKATRWLVLKKTNENQSKRVGE